MQKQKFNPAINSVSLHYGPLVVHGHAQDSALNNVVHRTLLNELNRTCEDMFDKMACVPAAAPTFECEVTDGNTILESLKQWQTFINSQEPVQEFEPCSIPDWMRPGLKEKGMTDAEIDSILITGIEPSWDETPGVVFRTVTIP